MDARAKQIAVGANNLLTGQAAQPYRLDADALHRAALLAKDNEVTDLERPVQHDGQRREQVTENVLRRQGDSDAADAEARDERGDIDP